MDRNLRNEIERLLDEPEDRPDSDGARRLVHARLAADLAEGVNGESVDKDIDSGELARVAAFLDGRLSQSERDAVARTLTRDASFRADLASAAALLDAVDAAPQSAVPA